MGTKFLRGEFIMATGEVLLVAVKQAVDNLMTDTSLDDDTKNDLLSEVIEYVEDQQELLGEDDDDEEEDDEEEDDDEEEPPI
jgi:uncharacterized membrane protein YukC